jgi:hypothetical protein
MRDPHVVSLRYRLETDPSLTFDNPPPIEQETDEFTLHLADGVLTCMMKAHYASVGAARAGVDQILLAWELDFALQQGRRVMRFVYQESEVIDRDPPPLALSERFGLWRPSTLRLSAVPRNPIIQRPQRASRALRMSKPYGIVTKVT